MGQNTIFNFFIFFLLIFISHQTNIVSKEHIPSEYFLPSTHPIKPQLDHLFSSTRVTFSLDSLFESGFQETKPRKFTHLIVTSHPLFPGYIFKLYLDTQKNHKDKPEEFFWCLRVQGARLVQLAIDHQNLDHLFKVPKKWIYQLPSTPEPPLGYYQKNYILIEQNMDLFDKADNYSIWKSSYVTHDLLNHFYDVLKQVGLSDCAKPDNAPFSKDGRIAFIDTQTHGETKIRFDKLNDFLSKENRSYWKTLTQQ